MSDDGSTEVRSADRRVREYGWRTVLFLGLAAAFALFYRYPSAFLEGLEVGGYSVRSALPALAVLSLVIAVSMLPLLVRSLWEWHLFER